MTDATPAPAVAKESSLGKKVFRIVVLLVLLVLVAIVGLYFARNALVRQGVIRGGEFATDQATALEAADLSLGGSLTLNSLDINNVGGKNYKAPKILVMKKCDIVVQPSSLLSSTVQVDTIAVDGLEITLEQDGMSNNLNDLMAIIQKKTAATSKTDAKTSPGKELKIGTIKLTNSKVHIRGIATMDLNLPDMEMKDPTNPDGRPMKIADLVGRIIVQVGKQIIENPQIPGDIKNAMKNVDAVVNSIKGELEKGFKDLKLPDNKALQDMGKNLNNLNPFNTKDATK